jgi:DNA replication and repair protein RecF
MVLKHLSLQNFRSYKKSTFAFNQGTTFIVGQNTAGKTNIMEAIYTLATGKSFWADKDIHMVRFGQPLARTVGKVQQDDETINLEVVIATAEISGKENPSKRYLVNSVPKRRVDFMGNLLVVLFSPLDIELLSGSPGNRREFLDSVLEQTDQSYRYAVLQYTKALRQRNALLEQVQETGIRNPKLFEYWDDLIISHGQQITKKRQTFLDYINETKKDMFDFEVTYDHSIISHERLFQYKDAEVGAGVTLVGPHRDDFSVKLYHNSSKSKQEAKWFGSRGQQRLIVLQLKLLQLSYIKSQTSLQPVLLLDDIFSELDEKHIAHVLEKTTEQQTIITTTHEEFIKTKVTDSTVVELG